MKSILRLAGTVALTGALAAALFAPAARAQDDEPLVVTFLNHSTPANTFWQAVKKGMDDACAMIEADCQMIFLNQDGNVQEQLNNLDAAIAQNVDVIVTSLINDDIFDEAVHRAREQGIIVIGSNVDDTQTSAGNERQSFIGQDLRRAGYELARALSEQFPAEGPIHVLIGLSGPGQSWSEQRAAGVEDFVKEYIDANPDREISYEKIDSGLDLAITGQRVAAYVQANPNTTAYLDTGYWEAGAANTLRDIGKQPGEVLLAGFDLVPVVLDEMEKGYIQLTVDQQPYLQGFLPVMQAYLMKRYGLSAWDVNTGKSLITPDQVASVKDLAAQGLR